MSAAPNNTISAAAPARTPRARLTLADAGQQLGLSSYGLFTLLRRGFIQGRRKSPLRASWFYQDSVAAHKQATRDPQFWKRWQSERKAKR